MKPVRVVTSKPARQTYLNTFLFMVTSAILLGIAILAYTLFYFNYVPQIGIEKIIHLQYGDGPHPYGITSLDSYLVHDQPYDISLSLHLPRSPSNLATGNFMLSLTLLSPSYMPTKPPTAPPSPLQLSHSSTIEPNDILLTSRRPAILTYTSRLVSLSERLITLPLYTLGLRRESEVLHVPMIESASFKKGYTNVPAYVLLELQTGQEVQVYDVRVHLVARFGGLRWIMYYHRIVSFVLFVCAFWVIEVIWTGLGWIAIRAFFMSPNHTKPHDIKEEESEVIKKEEDTDDLDLSDTPRTFPTYGKQPPLRYVPKVKEENSEEYVLDETTIHPLAAEADDESEDILGQSGRDSGIGTSYSEGGERGLTRKRSKGRNAS